MKRTVMAVIEVEDSVNNGQVLDTLENKFVNDNDDNVYTYVMVDELKDFIVCEFIG